MKVVSLLRTLPALAVVVLLPGCLFETPDYHVRRLPSVSRNTANYCESKRGVRVSVKELDYYECQHMFDGHGKKLFKGSNPIYPIQITIENRSDTPWEFSPQDINLRLCESQDVVDKINWSPVARGIGLAVAGGLAIWGASKVLGSDAAIVAGVAAPVAVGVGTANQASKNDRKKRELESKSLNEDLIVYPCQKINTYIFVRAKDYKPNFNITMYNTELDETMRFRVQL